MNEIRDARVKWYEGKANMPRLVLLVDRIPELQEFTFQAYEVDPEDARTLYLGRHGKWRVFFIHNPDNERGYAGRMFTFKMEHGTVVKVKGPWSGTAGLVNKVTEERIVSVHVTDDRLRFETDKTLKGDRAVHLDWARAALENCCEDVGLTKELHFENDEPYYVPTKMPGRSDDAEAQEEG